MYINDVDGFVNKIFEFINSIKENTNDCRHKSIFDKDYDWRFMYAMVYELESNNSNKTIVGIAIGTTGEYVINVTNISDSNLINYIRLIVEEFIETIKDFNDKVIWLD